MWVESFLWSFIGALSGVNIVFISPQDLKELFLELRPILRYCGLISEQLETQVSL